MKHIFLIFFTLSCTLANAQLNTETIYFKDHTKLKGIVKHKPFGVIKYKANKDAKYTTYSSRDIIGFGNDDVIKYRYISNKTGQARKLYREEIKGNISLYSITLQGGGGFAFGPPSISNLGYYSPTTTTYYLLIKGELIKIGAKLKNKHLNLFKNCPRLVTKIKKREFKRRELYEIVNYHKHSCH